MIKIKSLTLENIIFIVATILLGLLAFFMLFIRPVTGMADNGDFFREIHNNGLYYLTGNFEDRHFGYFNRIFGIRQFPYDKNTVFVSSLSLLIKVAVALDRLITRDFIFDLRFLAAIYCVFFLIAFYILIKNTGDYGPAVAGISAALALIVFGDAGYIVYFNSFYGEPVSLIFLMLTLGLALRLLKKERPSIADILLLTAASLMFVCAKQQNSPSGILIAVLFIRLAFIKKEKVWRITVVSSAAVLLLTSAFMYLTITDDIKNINQYHAFTRGILQGSREPLEDTEKLGLDKKFSMLAGTTYYDRYPMEMPESQRMKEEFYPNFGFVGIAKYYFTHPDRLFEKLSISARNGFSIRPEVIGNYEKAEGKSYGEKTYTFSLWSSMKEKAFPRTIHFVILFYAGYFAVLIKKYFGYAKKAESKGMIRLEIFAFVAVTGIMQFGVSFVGAGDADLAKHLFLFNVCFDFMFLTAAVFALRTGLGKLRNLYK